MFGRRSKTYRTTPIRDRLIDDLNSTQAKIAGFDIKATQAAHVLMIGAGGIGFPTANAVVHKGIGRLSIVDDDIVEIQNLTRQFFDRSDIGKYKAHALAQRLAADGLFATTIEAHPFRFQELLERGHDLSDVTLIIAGVDNNPTRKAVCQYAIEHNVPAIFAAVSRGGNESYVVVQEPRKACWACVFPHYLDDASHPCGLPGICDVLMVVAGQIVFSIDTLISGRPRSWNVRDTFLDGSLPDRARTVARRTDCAVCGYTS